MKIHKSIGLFQSRILKNDLNRIGDDDDDGSVEEENGWKIIHTDVFRFPHHRELFSSIIGVGCQFLSIFSGILFFAFCGMFTVHRHGSLMASGVILYAFTSCVAGFMSGKMYRQLQGEHWTWNIILTANLFTIPFFVIWSVINTFAWAHGTTQALPYTTVLILVFMWLFGKHSLNIGRDDVCRFVCFSWISIDGFGWNIWKELFVEF